MLLVRITGSQLRAGRALAGDSPPYQSFAAAEALVDVADRDALYHAMEGRQYSPVDTNVLVYACAEFGNCR